MLSTSIIERISPTPTARPLIIADNTFSASPRLSLADCRAIGHGTPCGWTNSHLHEFRVGTKRYGMVDVEEDLDWDEEEALLDERKFTVGSVLSDDLDYFEDEYDFGDGWDHVVKVEKILIPDQTNDWPMCIAGENACPPEDVGGSYGFKEFVEIMANPKHEQHAEMYRWFGGPFDQRGFDVNSANARIRCLR